MALLRGINVGGKNPVPMADLRTAFESEGFTAVRTYIQSGNVLFSSDQPRAELEERIETMLEKRFGMALVVVVRSRRQLRAAIEMAPDGFGTSPDTFHSDVIFLRSPLTPKKAMTVVQVRDGVDQAWPGTGVIYFARLSERRTESRLSRIVGTSEYQQMTVRNWSTASKLGTLIDDDAT